MADICPEISFNAQPAQTVPCDVAMDPFHGIGGSEWEPETQICSQCSTDSPAFAR
jgi:hypothetical protein